MGLGQDFASVSQVKLDTISKRSTSLAADTRKEGSLTARFFFSFCPFHISTYGAGFSVFVWASSNRLPNPIS